LAFKILFRKRVLRLRIKNQHVSVENLEGEAMDLILCGLRIHLESGATAQADI
jgi:hypothetical protein